MLNYLSIDLESWAMPNTPEFLQLKSQQKKRLDNGHAEKSTLKILDILQQTKTKTTFFIVGQIYQWYPKLVEKITRDGHEVAFHTHAHDPLPDESSLIRSLELSKEFIQKFKPIGFRAPRINFGKKYFPILKKYGFKYDSSSYGEFYSQFVYKKVKEFPVSAWKKIPIGSGYFIGLLGNHIDKVYQRLNRSNTPFISFLHNWQILSPLKPTFPTRSYLITHPHYFPYLKNTSKSLEYLVKKFSISPMKNLLQ